MIASPPADIFGCSFWGSTIGLVALVKFASSFVPNLKIRNFSQWRFMIGMNMPDRWTIVSLLMHIFQHAFGRTSPPTLCRTILGVKIPQPRISLLFWFLRFAYEVKPTVCECGDLFYVRLYDQLPGTDRRLGSLTLVKSYHTIDSWLLVGAMGGEWPIALPIAKV